MTVKEAAEELGLTPQRVRQFCREGRLGQRLGREWVITREELEEFKKIPRKPGVSIGLSEDEEE